jgi:hypothetical protein
VSPMTAPSSCARSTTRPSGCTHGASGRTWRHHDGTTQGTPQERSRDQAGAERADQFAEPGPALDRIARTAEALQWSAQYCSELQVKIDAATRALGKARS